MDSMKTGWFSETNATLPEHELSLCLSVKVEEVLYRGKSQYQDILVLQTKQYGRALVLDGLIQCTERDEFVYQEMICFLPLCAHPNPSKVLIVGGGDGGVARECHKHPLVTEIVQVEIDSLVIEVSKQYLPFMASGFSSSKLTLHVGDGFEYLKTNRGVFDAIITDSSDPVGPNASLFTESYFRMLKMALKPGGVICSQVGSFWTDLESVRTTMESCRKHFKSVKYATAAMPTYIPGQIGFMVAALDKQDLVTPKRVFGEVERKDMNLRFYNERVHAAAFALPNFVQEILQ